MKDGRGTIESLAAEIARLVADRQRLRSEDAATLTMEENRRAIAASQQLLSELLIERHRPPTPA